MYCTFWKKYGLKTAFNGMRREVGGRFKTAGHMYTYGWFTLMFGRSQPNSIQQLSFTYKINKFKIKKKKTAFKTLGLLFHTKSFCICSWPIVKFPIILFFWILFHKAAEHNFVLLRVWVCSEADTDWELALPPAGCGNFSKLLYLNLTFLLLQNAHYSIAASFPQSKWPKGNRY